MSLAFARQVGPGMGGTPKGKSAGKVKARANSNGTYFEREVPSLFLMAMRTFVPSVSRVGVGSSAAATAEL